VNWFSLPDRRAQLAACNELLYLAIPAAVGESVSGFPPPPISPTRLYAFSTLLRDGRWHSAYSGVGQRVDGLPGGEELPSLPGDRALISLAASEVGVLALLGPSTAVFEREADDEATAAAPLLQLLPRKGIAPQWISLSGVMALPRVDLDSRVELVAGLTTTSDSMVTSETTTQTPLAMVASGVDGAPGQFQAGYLRSERLQGPPRPMRLGGGVPMRYVVTWETLELPTDVHVSALRGARVSFTHSGLVLAVRSGESAWRLWIRGFQRNGRLGLPWRELATVDEVSGPPVLLPMDGENRVMLLWPGKQSERIAASDRLASFLNIQSAQVSTSTGRLMERGAMHGQPTLTTHEYRLVGLLMAWVVGLIALVLVRPREATILLPGEVSLAEPLRRMVAGLIDITLSATLAAFLVNGSFEEVMTIGVFDLFVSLQGQSLLLATLLVGVATSTLGESLTGRTVGKWFVGSLVVRCASPGASADHALQLSYPTTAQAFVRNVIKWCLPPAAFVAIWREGARHRGEQYTNTAVVVPILANDDEDIE